MTDTIFAMEFLPVDKIPAYTLEANDYIHVDGDIVLVKAVFDNDDDTVTIQYVDDFDELGEFVIHYDTMLSIYMLFD